MAANQHPIVIIAVASAAATALGFVIVSDTTSEICAEHIESEKKAQTATRKAKAELEELDASLIEVGMQGAWEGIGLAMEIRSEQQEVCWQKQGQTLTPAELDSLRGVVSNYCPDGDGYEDASDCGMAVQVLHAQGCDAQVRYQRLEKDGERQTFVCGYHKQPYVEPCATLEKATFDFDELTEMVCGSWDLIDCYKDDSRSRATSKTSRKPKEGHWETFKRRFHTG